MYICIYKTYVYMCIYTYAHVYVGICIYIYIYVCFIALPLCPSVSLSLCIDFFCAPMLAQVAFKTYHRTSLLRFSFLSSTCRR